ncbi:RES family NAD+ phosphorylase [Flavitalea flava]
MKVYRISKCRFIDDLKGTGAAGYPGRWHSRGTYILYTAGCASLALLETVVHISTILVSDFCMICLEIPEDKIITMTEADLPADWKINPSPDNLKTIGDQFIRENKYVALRLPSAVMPEENNYLLNPNHPDFDLVKEVYQRRISVDERLLKK